MNSPIINFLLLITAIAIVLVIILVIIAVIAIRQLQRFVSPNTDALKNQFDRLSAANPNASAEMLLRKIIHQQALKCGLVGAITGVGGFITFPIALPIDLILSMRIQATTVQFVAMTCGQSPTNSVGLRLQTHLITTGSVEMTETTFSFIMKIVARLLGESLSIFIPAIGAIVGFSVNYAIAQANGQLALRWYSSRSSGSLLPGVNQAIVRR